jgi:hypothetical protein
LLFCEIFHHYMIAKNRGERKKIMFSKS